MTTSLTESLSVFGNANHLAGFLAEYEFKLLESDEESKFLVQAPNYFAWLNVAAEQVFYRVREMIYVNTEDEKVFDMPYSDLLNHLIEDHAPEPEQLEPVILFAKVRHLIVHKGFPNPHVAPSEKARNVAKGYPSPPRKYTNWQSG